MSSKMPDLAAYFYEHVFLAYLRYEKVKNDHVMGNNMDRREAINASIALYHLREHIPQPFRKSRNELAALCRDYDLLGDIVNASKHNVVTHGTPQITGLNAIQEIVVSTRFYDEKGEYFNGEKVVEVQLADGSIRDIYEILTNVVNMWFDELHQMGAIDQKQPIRLKKQGLVFRKDASNVSLQVTAGIQWKESFRFQEYDYASNTIKPIDLSNAKNITFTVRKPPTFELELHDPTGVKTIREIELTPEQVIALKKIDDPSQRNQYLLKIAAQLGIVEQMIVEYKNAETKSSSHKPK